MAYTTTRLGMKLADPLTIQAFETTQVNANFLTLEEGLGIRTFRWNNAAEKDAQTGMAERDMGHRLDNKTIYKRINGVWQVWDSEWNGYTPTLFSSGLGNGSIFGAFRQHAETVEFWAKFILGSTSTVSGGTEIGVPTGLPITSALSVSGQAWDIGGNTYPLSLVPAGASTRFGLFLIATSGTYGVNSQMNATTPVTWAATDYFYIGGSYRSAWA